MAGEGDHQAGEATKKTKGGRKGKVVQQVQIDDEATDSNKTEFNEAEVGSDSDDDNERYDYCTLAKIMEHLEGTYDSNHPKWNRTFDDALAGVLHSTLDTEGEHNILYLLLNISKACLTFHQTWKKIEKGLTSEATRTSQQITLLAQLNEVKMFNADTRKLIQEIRVMQMETSLLGAPFGDDAIYAALQRCTIRHPVYKETVATVHQVSFDALATALMMRQSAIKSIPAQKVDPRQASARAAGSNEQDSDTDEDAESSKAKTRPRRIRCWEVWCSLTPSWRRPPKPDQLIHWVLDLGATFHMINDYSMLIHPRKCRKRVYTAGSEVLEATAVGDVSISTEYGEILLQNVLYVHSLNINLLSTNSLTDEGAHVTLDPKGGQIHLADGTLLKIVKNHKSGLLETRGDTW
ncbi:uncharacterized protein UDID_17482 [Ustilago sp. UG-2017a]|nr:uncharacterized protein UDID_17482 [Ustilago sp. UG-2017a]